MNDVTDDDDDINIDDELSEIAGYVTKCVIKILKCYQHVTINSICDDHNFSGCSM